MVCGDALWSAAETLDAWRTPHDRAVRGQGVHERAVSPAQLESASGSKFLPAMQAFEFGARDSVVSACLSIADVSLQQGHAAQESWMRVQDLSADAQRWMRVASCSCIHPWMAHERNSEPDQKW